MKKHVATITIKGARKRVRPSYKRGVEFIALNLDIGETAYDARDDIAVIAIAEAFGKEPADVAADVFRIRGREDRIRAQAAARVRKYRARKANVAGVSSPNANEQN
jgi:hypothetical protein